MTRNRQRIDDLPGRRHDLERHDHVFDLAVLGREHARAAVREESADGRAGDGGGEMHRRVAGLFNRPFEMLRIDAGFTGDGECARIDFDDPVHAFHVEDDAAVDRQRAALGAGTAAPRGDRDSILVRDLHDPGDLSGRTGMNHEVGPLRLAPAVVPHLRNPVVVDRVSEGVRRPGIHEFRSDRVHEFAADHLVHVVVSGKLHSKTPDGLVD